MTVPGYAVAVAARGQAQGWRREKRGEGNNGREEEGGGREEEAEEKGTTRLSYIYDESLLLLN